MFVSRGCETAGDAADGSMGLAPFAVLGLFVVLPAPPIGPFAGLVELAAVTMVIGPGTDAEGAIFVGFGGAGEPVFEKPTKLGFLYRLMNLWICSMIICSSLHSPSTMEE